MKHRRIPSLALALVLAFSLAVPSLAAEDTAAFPEKYDLRDENLVSSVKLQGPFGTCWGFGTTAAAEISVLAELRALSPELAEKYADPNALDFSELQLAWFAFNPIPEDDPDGQGGEGIWVEDSYPLNAGGSAIVTASVYSAGTGPIEESLVPYRNRENVLGVDARGRTTYAEKKDDGTYYDWSVDEAYRNTYSYELEEAIMLPDPYTTDEEGKAVFHPESLLAVKNQLMNEHRGVSVAYCADTFRPDQSSDAKALYINATDGTWAHYTWSEDGGTVDSNHVVCIVGWDDNYSRDNFLAEHKPPADGAWICKNSWGAETNEVPHKAKWGVDGSGYFYLSYYDLSINELESFNFDVEGAVKGETSYIYIEQYDTMPAAMRHSVPIGDAESPGRFANVFTAEGNLLIRTIGVQTCDPGATVTAEIYRLSGASENPTDGELVARTERSFEYAGYHRLPLPEALPMPRGTRYSVVVTEISDGVSLLPMSRGVDASPTPMGGIIHYNAVVNRGESFVCEDSEWTDWAEYLEMMQSVMPDEKLVADNHAIKVYADPAISLPADVDKAAWYAGPVQFALDNEWMELAGENQFRPGDAADRNALERAVKALGFEGSALFEGLPEEGALNREQIAAVLYRCAQEQGKGFTGAWMFLLDYPDASEIAEWADEAMHWMVMNGVIGGTGRCLEPKAIATRAQLAVILARFTSALG